MVSARCVLFSPGRLANGYASVSKPFNLLQPHLHGLSSVYANSFRTNSCPLLTLYLSQATLCADLVTRVFAVDNNAFEAELLDQRD